MLRKTRHRGVFKVGWVFTFVATAYNLVRMRICCPRQFSPHKLGEKCVRMLVNGAFGPP
jgi:hypothetical protein